MHGLTHVVFRCASAAVRCMVSTIPTSKKKAARQDVPAGIVSHDRILQHMTEGYMSALNVLVQVAST